MRLRHWTGITDSPRSIIFGRPCKLEPQALKGVDEWLERYRKLWEERFDRLDEYLRELQAKQGKEAKDKKRGRKKQA